MSLIQGYPLRVVPLYVHTREVVTYLPLATTLRAMESHLAPTDPDHRPTVSESIVIHSPHLEKLWTYNCPLTKKRIVTCLAWNPVNKV